MTSFELDLSTVAAAIGVFITTVYLTWKGWKDEKKKVSREKTDVVAGLIQNNMSLHDNTDAHRQNTAAMTRLTDTLLLTGRRK